MSRLLICIVAVLFLFSRVAYAQDETIISQTRPKIGLVLGGGGARGLAHVGIIQVLEENHIPVDVVSGTSMGAIVGSLYASGYSAEELYDITISLNWAEIFSDETARGRSSFRKKQQEYGFLTNYKLTFKNGKVVLPKGVIQGQNLFLELSKLLEKTRTVGKFEDLPIPFRLVATDLDSGEEAVMVDGDLATAVFASMAIPGAFPPVERNGRYLIDGGFVNNVPTDLAKQLGADILIAINVGQASKPASEMTSFLDVIRQTQIILSKRGTQRRLDSLTDNDILITPDMGNLGPASFGETAAFIEYGRKAARAYLPKLVKYKLNDADWAAHIASRNIDSSKFPIIGDIQIVQNSKLSSRILRRGISQSIGQQLNAERLNSDIEKLYADNVFNRITYDLIETGPTKTLKITGLANDTSNGYFKFGILLDSNLEDDSNFELGVSYTKPQINQYGAEWRSELNVGDTLEGITEFYQPLGASQNWFLDPSIYFKRDRFEHFDISETRRGELKVFQYGASLTGGYLFGSWGQINTGLTMARGNLNFTDPTLSLGKIKLKDTSYNFQFLIDTLDSVTFPTTGIVLNSKLGIHDDILGGDFKYETWELNAYKPFTQGRHTIAFVTRLKGETGTNANILGRVQLGGFHSLSGFSKNELSGQYAGLVAGNYYYRLNQQSALFDAPMYLGASLEMGNVFQDWNSIALDNLIYAGSIYAGIRSPMGPVLIGFGYNDTGASSVYFSLGRPF